MIGPPRKVVARYVRGTMVKGYSYDFAPNRSRFHIFSARDAADDPTPILLRDLKAVFFVRDFAGNPAYNERKTFAPGERPEGRRVRVVFLDNEVLVGSLDGHDASAPGLFVTPADPGSNNLRVYAVSNAIRRVQYLPPDRPPAPPAAPVPAVTPAISERLLAWLLQPVRPTRRPARQRVGR
jgi:hypothetical protein